jgi:hypothetical protein
MAEEKRPRGTRRKSDSGNAPVINWENFDDTPVASAVQSYTQEDLDRLNASGHAPGPEPQPQQQPGPQLLLRPFMPEQSDFLKQLGSLRRVTEAIIQNNRGKIGELPAKEADGAVIFGSFALDLARRKSAAIKAMPPDELMTHLYERQPSTRDFGINARTGVTILLGSTPAKKRIVGLRLDSYMLDEEVYTALSTVNKIGQTALSTRRPNAFLLLGVTTGKTTISEDIRQQLEGAAKKIVPPGWPVQLAPIVPPKQNGG